MRYSHGLDLNQFVQDEKTFDAVVRNLAVIREAAKHIPPEIRARYPDVEWNKLSGLRDIVTHRYFGLDEDILWDMIQHRPPLALLNCVWQILAAKARSDPVFDSAVLLAGPVNPADFRRLLSHWTKDVRLVWMDRRALVSRRGLTHRFFNQPPDPRRSGWRTAR